MKALMIGLFLLATGGAMAHGDAAPACSAIELDGAKYDIREGAYVRSEDSDNYFCERYLIRDVKHYSCNGNVSSFTITCASADSKVRTVNCEFGKCHTGDGSRFAVVSADSDTRLIYGNSEGKRVTLHYDGPCD